MTDDDGRWRLLEEARARLEDDDDPRACRGLCRRAWELDLSDEMRVQVLLLEAAAGYALDEGDAAREAMTRLAPYPFQDALSACDAGDLWCALGDDAAGERSYRSALERDDSLADAHYGLGLVHDRRGDEEGMIAAWLRTLELDEREILPPWHLPLGDFELVVEEALEELSPAALARLGNVPILVEPLPSRSLVEEGCDPRVLGLFSGVPLKDKSYLDSVPTLDAIHLFQVNLERACGSGTELREEIRITVLHETAHFFGLDEEELGELGLG